jgi:hypothetical protein
LIFIKKNKQTGLKKTKPNRNWFKPTGNWFKSTGFGSIILEQKTVPTNLAWFFRFDSVFFWFGSVFFVWVRFGFFGLRLKKPKLNRSVF